MSFRTAIVVIAGITLLGPCAYAAQQDQSQPSVADAARKAREEKKNLPKPAKVYTDDNIGSVQGSVSVVGDGGAAAPSSNGTGTATSAGSSHDAAYWHDKFSTARAKLSSDKRDLDLLQREYNLKRTQYYSDPNQALKEQFSSDELKSMRDKIDQRTQDVAKDQRAIDDLEDQLRQAGGDPGWAREDEQPSDQGSSASQSQESNQPSQSSQPSTPASQDQGSQPQSQPSSQDQGSQQPSQTPPPSPPQP
ncbi:MAG: hypothetical protein ACLP1Y_05545, partial [Candidatus Acidiferrales bacterium]